MGNRANRRNSNLATVAKNRINSTLQLDLQENHLLLGSSLRFSLIVLLGLLSRGLAEESDQLVIVQQWLLSGCLRFLA